MKSVKMFGLGLFVVGLNVVGCTQPNIPPAAPKDAGAATTTTAKSAPKEEEHAHGSGPNGGVVFDFGKHHAEFTVDHDKKECTILVLDGDTKDAKPLPIAAKELTVNIKETRTADGKVVAPMTIAMKPMDEKEGKASKFVGTDPGIGNVADFAGTVLGVIDGKPSQGEFKEE